MIPGKSNHGVFDDNLTFSNLFEYSLVGRDGTALSLEGNQTITLDGNSMLNFDIRGPFSICFWLKTDDPDAEILSSGKFSILFV